MKIKLFSILITIFLITISISITGIAGDEENPEINDELEDTDLSFLDIESAWIYEKTEEPEYLFTALKLKDFKKNFNAIYSIEWHYNNVEYTSGLDIFFLRSMTFRGGMPKRATYWQWQNIPECEGNVDQETNIITWKIPKINIGNPQKGDILTKTRANAVPGFPLSFIYFFIKDYRDFAPDHYLEYGDNYLIQY